MRPSKNHLWKLTESLVMENICKQLGASAMEQTAIQHHINIPATEVANYVEQFNSFSKKTSDAIIGMGRTIYEAKMTLAKKQFEQFRSSIRFDGQTSSIRKLELIGKKSELLSRHADNLPTSWTTLYELTQLGDDVFESLIESGKVSASMSGAAAKQLVSAHTNKSPKRKKAKPTSSNTSQTATSQAGDVPEAFYTLRIDRLPSREVTQELEQLITDFVAQRNLDIRLIRNNELDEYLQTPH